MIEIHVLRDTDAFQQRVFADLVKMGEPGLAEDYLTLCVRYDICHVKYGNARAIANDSVTHALHEELKELYNLKKEYTDLVNLIPRL